jgi:PHD/YefM family antitoxin component YafN of YafNO toxin-antitoxin module
LDKAASQILKFVNSDSGFVKANYFSATSPDLSKAVSMAIDSSVYILTSDGNISKFTKGASDTFTIAGLDTPVNKPTQISTNLNDDNVYVLDNGNSRIVVMDKSGNYKNQYQAAVVKSAKDFEVLEKDKKIYVLSGSKTYEIDLK